MHFFHCQEALQHSLSKKLKLAKNRIYAEDDDSCYSDEVIEEEEGSENEDEDGEYHFIDIHFSNDAEPGAALIQELFWEELFAALDELPENQRQVFVWNELEDLTLQQIADTTGENLKTIISRKRYAVQHLRKRLHYLYEDLLN